MNFVIATQAELLKTKRTASTWLTLIGAAIAPGVLFLIITFNPADGALKELSRSPWKTAIDLSFLFVLAFTLPAYIILVATLLPQLEFRNNTWKQVYASPQPIGHIFFSKFAALQLMILSYFLLFNTLLLGAGVVLGIAHPGIPFLKDHLDIGSLLRYNGKAYIALLPISALQYGMALRFRGFVAPVGIGLLLLAGTIVVLTFIPDYASQFPHAYPILSAELMTKDGRPLIENHEWNALGYTAFFLLLGFAGMKWNKSKG